jgi:hypothetical protein
MGAVGWQWQLLDEKGECLVSVVGGSRIPGCGNFGAVWYGDGVDTFEMWDMVNEPEPHAWLTKDEINAHLEAKGILEPAFEDLNIESIEPEEKDA